MKTLFICAIAILSLSVTACDSNKGPLNEGFGDAVNQNAAIHIIPPKYSAVTDIDMNGDRAALGFGRLKTGNVIQPTMEGTSNLGGGSVEK